MARLHGRHRVKSDRHFTFSSSRHASTNKVSFPGWLYFIWNLRSGCDGNFILPFLSILYVFESKTDMYEVDSNAQFPLLFESGKERIRRP